MKSRIQTLDVRPDIQAGREPYPRIMDAVEQLPAGARLRLLSPFKPAPLLRVMFTRGFTSTEKALPSGDWEITFERIDDIAAKTRAR